MTDRPDGLTAPQRGDVAVELDHERHIAVAEIRRGPNNFFDVELITELADVFEQLAEGTTRAIVLCAEGKNFCAGANFGQRGNRPGKDSPHLYDAAIRLFEQPLPIVCAVQGAAIGGGLGLAISADFRIATPSSRFAANFALLGFHHGFALSTTLPALVGQQTALDLLYTGRRVDGRTAHRVGLCDRLVSEDELRDEAVNLAAEIASSAPLAVRSIRQTMRGSSVETIRAAMAHERAEQERLQLTEDFIEGVDAVRKRRPAEFNGR